MKKERYTPAQAIPFILSSSLSILASMSRPGDLDASFDGLENSDAWEEIW